MSGDIPFLFPGRFLFLLYDSSSSLLPLPLLPLPLLILLFFLVIIIIVTGHCRFTT